MNWSLKWLFILAAAFAISSALADRWIAEYVDGVGRPPISQIAGLEK